MYTVSVACLSVDKWFLFLNEIICMAASLHRQKNNKTVNGFIDKASLAFYMSLMSLIGHFGVMKNSHKQKVEEGKFAMVFKEKTYI